jgi:hypothetical protein
MNKHNRQWKQNQRLTIDYYLFVKRVRVFFRQNNKKRRVQRGNNLHKIIKHEYLDGHSFGAQKKNYNFQLN